ncbi:MAG: hypothetical protein HYS06_00075 [Methylocystis sp.]|nr:hypothetical protein [Methylocystis sp.]MBI3274694.1 hypothetical protein [Methylocystis sp.]
MNTANLQLEGVYAVLAALLGAMRDKGVLNDDEIGQMLAGVEATLASDPHRPTELRAANVDAICFPARFLSLALQASRQREQLSFSQLALRVGQRDRTIDPKAR